MLNYIVIFLLLSIGSALIGYYYGRSHDQRKIKKYRVKKIKLTDNLTDDDIDKIKEMFHSATSIDKLYIDSPEYYATHTNMTYERDEENVLLNDIKTAIEEEDYEEAARLRDELNKLKNKKHE